MSIKMPKQQQKKELKIIFEDFPENTVFNSGGADEITWKDLRKEMEEEINKIRPKLGEAGIRKVEVGSIGWFYIRNRTRGRFVPLNSMFFARLLKR